LEPVGVLCHEERPLFRQNGLPDKNDSGEARAMLRIAVCDDEEMELRHIADLTRSFLSERGLSAEIREFSHPDTLLSVCDATAFHIYLLDMVMPMLSGLELGQSIRSESTDAQIIYITTEAGFALDAYSVNPLHYLLKPVAPQALFPALELAAKKVGFGEEAVIAVKTREGLRTIRADAIVCCEYSRHTVGYTLQNGEKITSLSLSDSFSDHIAPLLRDKRFIRPHAAFAVNMNYVERLDKTGFTMRGGAYVPVSGKQYSAVRNTYLDYRLGAL